MRKCRSVMALLLAMALITTTAYQNRVSADSVGDLRAQQEHAESEAAELESRKAAMEEALAGLNSDLVEVSNKVAQLESEIGECEQQIATATTRLAEAQALCEQQYADMKLRIKFMYENSNDNLITTLMESRNFADFLNRVSYVNELSTYDRLKLNEYRETKEEIAAYKSQLETQQTLLVQKQEEVQKQQEVLLADIRTTKKNISDAEASIAQQKEKAKQLKSRISALIAYEQKLEEQRAQAEAARVAQQGSSGTTGKQKVGKVSASVSETELLAALIYCEAGGESYTAQVAVGSVVINRIHSSSFPNSLTGVIYQSGQFSPARSGRLAVVIENNLTTDSCRKAARKVLGGTVTGSWLYFCYNTGRVSGTVIGKQVFY